MTSQPLSPALSREEETSSPTHTTSQDNVTATSSNSSSNNNEGLNDLSSRTTFLNDGPLPLLSGAAKSIRSSISGPSDSAKEESAEEGGKADDDDASNVAYTECSLVSDSLHLVGEKLAKTAT